MIDDKIKYYFLTETDYYCKKCKTRLFDKLIIDQFDNYGCWKCGKTTKILMVSIVAFENDKLSFNERYYHNQLGFLPYLEDEEIGRFLTKTYPLFYKDHSRFDKSTYYMNHCQHCGIKQVDYFIYHEDRHIDLVRNEIEPVKTTILQLPNNLREDYSFVFNLKKLGNDSEPLVVEFLCKKKKKK